MSTCRHTKKPQGDFKYHRGRGPKVNAGTPQSRWEGKETEKGLIRKAAGCGDQWRKWRMEQGVANCQTCWSQIDPCHLPPPKASLCHRLICNSSHCLFLYLQLISVKFLQLNSVCCLTPFILSCLSQNICYHFFYISVTQASIKPRASLAPKSDCHSTAALVLFHPWLLSVVCTASQARAWESWLQG